jgi:hypothetical protein
MRGVAGVSDTQDSFSYVDIAPWGSLKNGLIRADPNVLLRIASGQEVTLGSPLY